MRIRCGRSATSYLWSKSDDGSAANAVILDTSSDKYTVVDNNSLDISYSLDNIIEVDGGLYRCASVWRNWDIIKVRIVCLCAW